jgi:DNA helicase MCM9
MTPAAAAADGGDLVDGALVPFLLAHARAELLDLLRHPEADRHHGVPVSLAALAAAAPAAAGALAAAPRAGLPRLDAALLRAQEALLAAAPPAERAALSLKENAHARLRGLCAHLDPAAREAAPPPGAAGAPHLDRLLVARGAVVRTGAVRVMEARRLYECGRCGGRFVVAADLEAGATVALPAACPARGARGGACRGTDFRHCEEVALYTDYQEVQVQEGRGGGAPGAAPRPLTVILQDELADGVQVGDDVEVTGVLIRQFAGAAAPGARCHVGLALAATAVARARAARGGGAPPGAAAAFARYWARRPGAPLAARDALVAALCPQLRGLFRPKLAALLMLLGGVPQRGAGAADVRGEIHLLLVGDPGTGKSAFQRAVSRLAPRAVVTSGRGATAAGLTAAAVREGGAWALEAGALVLADGGVCCIDEVDGLREAAAAALHEAMEQQSVSVAKGGVVATLRTRAAVFGACNPRGHRRYNPRRALAEQIALSPPLLSRFDIVLLLLDDSNPATDAAVADHVLATHARLGGPAGAAAAAGAGGGGPAAEAAAADAALAAVAAGGAWSLEALRCYVAWAREALRPTLAPAAEEVLAGYYRLRRGADAGAGARGAGGAAARATVRTLEALVRVAQAHARLMGRDEALLQDAVVAVALIDGAADGAGGGGAGALGALPGGGRDGFADDPDAEYAALEAAVLRAVRADGALALGGGGGGGGGWSEGGGGGNGAGGGGGSGVPGRLLDW